MDSERGGLLKTRAEDFARHLHTRLRSLKNDNGPWVTDDGDINEVYSDIDSSLASPEEELAEPIFITDQNTSFPLQRDGSSDSQYFDTVENVEDLSPVELKKIPILHLRTESKPIIISNGHRNLRDVDSGCSRVHEVDSIDLETDTLGGKINNCDIEAFTENNNSKAHSDGEALILVTNGEVFDIEVDNSLGDETKVPTEEAEEASEASQNSFCVFCDIEQIKTSLSNGALETDKLNEGLNGQCEEIKLEDNLSKPTTPLLSLELKNECTPDVDKNVSLADLLQVLKQDVTEEQIQPETNSTNAENTVCSPRVCPDIQVHESSPVVTVEPSRTEGDDDCDIETKRRNFRRCSSLKSGKTPPGTPGRKKIVRFADVLGLDLADVKTFLDEVPTIPKSAYEDLHGIELSSSPVFESTLTRIAMVRPKPEKVLIPLFQQPSVQPNFLDRVRNNNVCLESAYVSDSAFFAITGLVRVKNIDFHKSVYVRYSIDKWRSFSDLQARYVPNSCDGFSDKFNFVLYAHTLAPGQRLEFAVRFHTAGAQYWDSNGGSNYIFECINQLPPDPGVPPSPMETWAAFY